MKKDSDILETIATQGELVLDSISNVYVYVHNDDKLINHALYEFTPPGELRWGKPTNWQPKKQRYGLKFSKCELEGDKYRIEFLCSDFQLLKQAYPKEAVELKLARQKLWTHMAKVTKSILDRNKMLELWTNLAHMLLMINRPRVIANRNIVALLVDSDWNIVRYAFKPEFGQDHAETLLLSADYRKPKEKGKEKNYMLITSLYPCSMCLGRINFSKIDICVYLEPDSSFLNVCCTEYGNFMPVIQFPLDRLWFKEPYAGLSELREIISLSHLPDSETIRHRVREYLNGKLDGSVGLIAENMFLQIVDSERSSMNHLKVVKSG
ncbi:hypothetical protein MP228_007523 [Amoeboaphelidium protococcarum]|nr:hypothetical protein MP228_007523 [Amoeboaphelidium protococcarum]